MSKYISISVRLYASKKDEHFEKFLLNCGGCGLEYTAGQKIYEYARKILGKRWLAGEKIILSNGQKNAHYAYLYAKYVIKGRWKKAEKFICKSKYSAYLYTRYVMKQRWEEAEPVISKDFSESTKYARHILKGRFTIAEKNVDVSSWDAKSYYEYARYVIKGRWKKVEPAIAASRYIADYMALLDETGKEEFYNRVLMEAMNEKNSHHYYQNPAKAYIESLKKTGTNN